VVGGFTSAIESTVMVFMIRIELENTFEEYSPEDAAVRLLIDWVVLDCLPVLAPVILLAWSEDVYSDLFLECLEVGLVLV